MVLYMPILDPPSLLELVLIVCCHLLELSLTFCIKVQVCTLNLKVPVKR